MIEREKTFLLKYFPENLFSAPKKEIIDVYLPKTADHPVLRLRKNGESYEITKKQPIVKGDSSCQKEQTIVLTEEEFSDLFSQLDGKKLHKMRYYYEYLGRKAEIDVFLGDLQGLVLVDFEFETDEEKEAFCIPDFCLVEVTQEKDIAGGMLCAKKYADIEEFLNRFLYQPLLP
jgi:CYTH domain-containing protein